MGENRKAKYKPRLKESRDLILCSAKVRRQKQFQGPRANSVNAH